MKRKSTKDLSKRNKTSKQSALVLRVTMSTVKILFLGTITFILSTGTAYGINVSSNSVMRSLSSSNFPLVDTERSTNDILDSYPAYLKFVVEVGKDIDRAQALKLAKIYDSLKKKNPRGAALFLKGLRFEMIQKVELMGKDPRTLSSSNPELRRWIGRYLVEWVREADEHLFRAYSASRSELAFSE